MINARNVNAVNAYSGSRVMHTAIMGKQPESEPSDFWRRLVDAWAAQGLPTSQNGVAMKLGMSQGSTRRWYTGEGYPEIATLREIAKLGKVNVDWLLMDTLPKSPTGKESPLGKLLAVWEQLNDSGKEHVYRAAIGELALTKPEKAPLRPSSPASKYDD